MSLFHVKQCLLFLLCLIINLCFYTVFPHAVNKLVMRSDKNKSVVLLSGGLDSSVTLAISKNLGFESHALTIRYGQRHFQEINSAMEVCRILKPSSHQIFDLDLTSFGGSALTDNIDVPKGSISSSNDIPSTYVPARNTIFLSLALAFAETIGSRDIFIGVSSVDFSGYPDCRESFIKSFETMANLGTKAVLGGNPFTVHAPLIHLSKAETILKGRELGVDFSATWTCYDPKENGKPCGLCESCLLRARGFNESGVIDPLLG